MKKLYICLLFVFTCFITSQGQTVHYYGGLNYTNLSDINSFHSEAIKENRYGYILGVSFSEANNRPSTKLQLSQVNYYYDTGFSSGSSAVIDAKVLRLELFTGIFSLPIRKSRIDLGLNYSYLLSNSSSGTVTTCGFVGCPTTDINNSSFRIFRKLLLGIYTEFSQDIKLNDMYDLRLGYTFNFNISGSLQQNIVSLREIHHYVNFGVVQRL